jgi:hydrogenase nickel incorporation protein HypA/HybF
MHELSLAERISTIAVDAAKSNGGHRIVSIRLRIGALSCVDPETLRFGMGVVSRGTLAEAARLDFVRIPCRLRCNTCGLESEREPLEPCPGCQSPGGTVLAGDEFSVEAIDIDDADDDDVDHEDEDAGLRPPEPTQAARIEREP